MFTRCIILLLMACGRPSDLKAPEIPTVPATVGVHRPITVGEFVLSIENLESKEGALQQCTLWSKGTSCGYVCPDGLFGTCEKQPVGFHLCSECEVGGSCEEWNSERETCPYAPSIP